MARYPSRVDLVRRPGWTPMTDLGNAQANVTVNVSAYLPEGRQTPGRLAVVPLEVTDDLAGLLAVQDQFDRRGWSDGLPVVPPAEALVEEYLTRWGRDPQEVVVAVPPQSGAATLRKIATNMPRTKGAVNCGASHQLFIPACRRRPLPLRPDSAKPVHIERASLRP